MTNTERLAAALITAIEGHPGAALASEAIARHTRNHSAAESPRNAWRVARTGV